MRPALWHRNNFAVVPTGVTTAAAPILSQFTGTADGWVPTNATITQGANTISLTSTGVDPILSKNVSFSGRQYPYIQIFIFRTAGSLWDGKVYYSTAGHTASASFYKQIPEPAWDGINYQLITLDMRTLTAGGTDWTDNTITNVRFDFGSSSLDQFQIDFIQFRGTIYPTAGLVQYTQSGYYNDNVNFFTLAGSTNTGVTNNINTTLAALSTSYQYIGYFLATATGVYGFGIASDDAGYLWIGATALTGYSTSNAAIAQPGLRGAAYTYSRNFLLTAGTYYPVRFITGNSGGAGGQFLQWNYSGGAFTNDGTGEYFYNSDVGLSLDELFTINVTNVGSTAYALSGTDRNGAVSGNDPALTFRTGDVVDFVVNAPTHPFWVKTSAVTGTVNGVSTAENNGVAVGTVRWRVTNTGTFYYICQIHLAMVGTITVAT